MSYGIPPANISKAAFQRTYRAIETNQKATVAVNQNNSWILTALKGWLKKIGFEFVEENHENKNNFANTIQENKVFSGYEPKSKTFQLKGTDGEIHNYFLKKNLNISNQPVSLMQLDEYGCERHIYDVPSTIIDSTSFIALDWEPKPAEELKPEPAEPPLRPYLMGSHYY